MGIGTSLGAYYDDAFHQASAAWDPKKYEPNEPTDNIAISPDEMMSNKSLNSDPKNITDDAGNLVGYGTDDARVTPEGKVDIDFPPLIPHEQLQQESLKRVYITGQDKAPDLPDINDVPKHDWLYNAITAAPGMIKNAFSLPGDVLSGKVQAGSTQEIERAADLAGLMVAGPAPVASKMADGTLGSFAGVTSKTVDKGALQLAKDAAEQGVHPDEIWQKTGFFKGADSRWRYEIPDQDAKLKPSGFDHTITPAIEGSDGMGWGSVGGQEALHTISVKDGNLRLPDVLDHPELYEAYPRLGFTKVKNFPYPTDNIGMLDAEHNTMYLKKDLHPDFARSVLLHEAQHMIQNEEGFSRGGTSGEFKGKVQDLSEFEHYKRLMGEVEARNVQARMDMDAITRKYSTPHATEDKPRHVQIYAPPGGPAQFPRMEEPPKPNIPSEIPGRFTPYSQRWPNNDNVRPLNEHEEFIKDMDELHAFGRKMNSNSEVDIHKYNKMGRALSKKFGHDPWEDVPFNPL